MARQKKAKRRQKRSGAPAGGATQLQTWWKPRAAARGARVTRRLAPPVVLLFRDVVPALVAAKVRLLRVVRALDAGRIDPAEHPALRDALAGLIQVGETLLVAVAACDQEPQPPTRPVGQEWVALLAVADDMCELVLDAVPPAARSFVAAAQDWVGGAAPEVWMEIAGHRALAAAAAAAADDDDDPPPFTDPEADRRAIAEQFATHRPADDPDLQVIAQEDQPLPDSRDVRAWLRCVPRPWLRAIAYMQRVSPEGGKERVVEAVAGALEDAQALEVVLREGLGRSERTLLLDLVLAGPLPLSELPDAVASALCVPWDWSLRLPSSDGGKLRAFGLVYVGTREGAPGVSIPPSIEASILAALRKAEAAARLEEVNVQGKGFDRPVQIAEHMQALRAAVAGGRPPRRRGRKPQVRTSAPAKDYVLDIELLNFEPLVSRRIVVSGRRTLGELHPILQSAMGWEDDHLHAFRTRDGSWRFAASHHQVSGAEDEELTTLDAIAVRKGSRFLYEYDFGDDWWHEIRVVERREPDPILPEPRCLEGQGACPPEDSGGVGGYAWRLEALADPDHLDHEDAVEWMGADFDPDAFDLERVNTRLSRYVE